MRLFLVRRKFRRGEFEGRAFGAENRAFEVAKTGGGSCDVDMVRGRVEHPHIGDAHSQVIVYALLNAFHLVPRRKNFDAEERRSCQDLFAGLSHDGTDVRNPISVKFHLHPLLQEQLAAGQPLISVGQ